MAAVLLQALASYPIHEPMNLPATVARWHIGKLAIMWVVCVLACFGSHNVGSALLVSNNRTMVAQEDSAAAVASLRPGLSYHGISVENLPEDEAARIRRDTAWAARLPIRQRYDGFDMMIAKIFWVAVPLMLLVVGLVMSWWWFAASEKDPAPS
jgi:hypothetical protein